MRAKPDHTADSNPEAPAPSAPDPTFWDRRAGRALTPEERRAWRRTLLDFFTILHEWADAADADRASSPDQGAA